MGWGLLARRFKSSCSWMHSSPTLRTILNLSSMLVVVLYTTWRTNERNRQLNNDREKRGKITNRTYSFALAFDWLSSPAARTTPNLSSRVVQDQSISEIDNLIMIWQKNQIGDLPFWFRTAALLLLQDIRWWGNIFHSCLL